MMGAGPNSAESPSWAAHLFAALSLIGAAALFGVAVWSVTFGAEVDLDRLRSPSQLDRHLPAMEALVGAAMLLAVGVAAAHTRRRGPGLSRLAIWFFVVGGVGLLLRLYTGPTAAIPMAFLVGASALKGGLATAAPWQRLVERHERGLVIAAVLTPTVVAFCVYCLFSLTRHLSFGSGSWDMGCYNHNIFLLGYGKPPISSVLGDAHFWGGTNHFMPVLYLFAPLAWTGSSSILLVVQALLIALAAVPLALLGRRAGLGPAALFGVCVAYLFAVGTQSFITFDFHELAPVPLCLFLAIHGFEVGRRWQAYLALLIIFMCKESAILYAGGVGGWLFLTRPGRRLEGLAIALVSLVGFWWVVSWLQPHFLEEHSRGMIHFARFKAFGDSLSEGLVHMARHPGKALLALFTPEQKAGTLLVSAGGFGFLPLLSPGTLWLALPNLVERFLSDKREMWGLTFHYSIVLVSVLGYATVRASARAHALVLALCVRDRREGSWVHRLAGARAFDLVTGLFLVGCTLGSFAVSPVGFEFSTLHKPYFSQGKQIDINQRAVAFVPSEAKVVAQNYFLPHLALRQHIWQPYERFVAKAEYVVLNPNEGPWPHDRRHVVRLVRRLLDDKEWRLVFSEGTTVIFSKRDEPSVNPTPALLESLGR